VSDWRSQTGEAEEPCRCTRGRLCRIVVWLSVLMALGATLAAAPDRRLVDAVKLQDRAAALALLADKVDVNVPQGDGATALHWAAHWNDVALAELLLRAGARVDAANDLGLTPLVLACANGSAPMAAALLGAGANPNAVAVGEPVLMTAARSGNADVVRALLDAAADVNATDDRRRQSALMWAAAHRHAEVVRVLIARGADVHARSRIDSRVVQRGSRYGGVVSRERAVATRAVATLPTGGSTPLLFAARSGDLASARLLVEAGADVNDTAPDGTSALVLASHSGHGPLAAFLAEQGADLDAEGSGYTALHAAVLRGDADLSARLVALGADVRRQVQQGTPSRRYSRDYAFNAAWIGATPFWLAARFAELEIMRMLAANGADPLATSQDQSTPLIAALAAGVDAGPSASDARERRLDPEELVKLMAERDRHERSVLDVATLAIDLGVDVNAVNYTGDTALHHATNKGFNAVIRLLVDRGARLDVRNKRGQTPLGIALRRPQTTEEGGPSLAATADLLRSLGAVE
jgi:ankyrin repeat protein